MGRNIADKLGKGISPQEFIDGMSRNQEGFVNWLNAFAWENEQERQFFKSLNDRDDLRCSILAAEWCGDVVRNMPVVFRAMEEAGIPVQVLILEENLDTMEHFLTMGGRAIPIVIITDTGGHVLDTWGPRPANVQAVMTKFKTENPDREAADYGEKQKLTYAEMARQYGEGAGYQAVIVRELHELLASF